MTWRHKENTPKSSPLLRRPVLDVLRCQRLRPRGHSYFGREAVGITDHRSASVSVYGTYNHHNRCRPRSGARGLRVASLPDGLLGHVAGSVAKMAYLKKPSAGAVAAA